MVLRVVHAAQYLCAMSDVSLVLRYTRRWVQYGVFAHIVICTLVGAVEGVLGK